ncbi:MAG TPA: sensor histidine kinase [Thermoanaerobaculia bacterium]|nr:sensor histidine kinase [Thermoanaerobaculia bacterium]
MTSRDDLRRLLRWGGFAIWAVVGLPVVFFELSAPSRGRPSAAFAAWAASFALFGIALALNTSRRRHLDRAGSLALAAGQAAAALSLMALPPCFGLEGALLVLVAFQLGGILSRRAAVAWMLVQSAGLLAIMWLHWGWHWGIVLAVAYLPCQLIAYATTRLLAQETLARERLTAANAELEATRELLAQSARIGERSRIARDLHDLLGHHLTALSLNLEIASHLTEGDARDRVETAQSVTKLLLGDVRGVVGELRQERGFDLPAALRKLAEGIPRPRIHVGISSALEIDDPLAGEVLLRCAQELVTNTVRHAEAENLWLEIIRSGEGIEIHARDDGRGAMAIRSGNGLAGMRERIEQRGGTLSVETAPGRGFAVTAILPLTGAAS